MHIKERLVDGGRIGSEVNQKLHASDNGSVVGLYSNNNKHHSTYMAVLKSKGSLTGSERENWREKKGEENNKSEPRWIYTSISVS